MGISVAEQTAVFLWSLLFGFFLGIFYDIFRIIRIAFSLGRVIILVQDILFWSVCGILTFMFFFFAQSGEVRIYIIIGELLGAVAYYFTLGVIVIKSSRVIINFAKRVIYRTLFIITTPVRFFIRLLSPIARRSARKLRVQAKNQKKRFLFKMKQVRIITWRPEKRKKNVKKTTIKEKNYT